MEHLVGIVLTNFGSYQSILLSDLQRELPIQYRFQTLKRYMAFDLDINESTQ